MEVRGALRATIDSDKPAYIRIGKKGEAAVHPEAPEFTIGKGIILAEGKHMCLLSTGNMLPVAVEAAQRLEAEGISTRLVSLHTIKPLDHSLLEECFDRFEIVATIEEHSMIGGLGSAVAEWLSDGPHREARLCRIGTGDEFIHESGNQDYAREKLGLTAAQIGKRLSSLLKSSRELINQRSSA